mmetsp:Transcript_1470/g.4358  ORF Transcript_1470/g.4358 Transcript_1470/m.4358 type:complete len:366 (-) Transcript_1470:397-1494(-)
MEVEQRHLVAQDAILDAVIQAPGLQAPVQHLQRSVVRGRRQRSLAGASLLRSHDQVNQLHCLRDLHGVLACLHRERLCQEWERLCVPLLGDPQVGRVPGLLSKQRGVLAHGLPEQVVRGRVVRLRVLELLDDEEALGQRVVDLGTHHQVLRLRVYMHPERRLHHGAAAVEGWHVAVSVRTRGGELPDVPAVEPVVRPLVPLRCHCHALEVHKGLVNASQRLQRPRQVAVKGLEEFGRLLWRVGAVQLQVVQHLERLEMPALLHPDGRDMIQPLHHPDTTTRRDVSRALEQHRVGLVKLVVLHVNANQVQRTSEVAAILKSPARHAETPGQHRLNLTDALLVRVLAVLKHLVGPVALQQCGLVSVC